MSAQRGRIFRAPGGTWAIRWRDAHGKRPQRNGFANKTEARVALEEELRKVRLGPLYRPHKTLKELETAYLKQYDVAPSTRTLLKYNLGKAMPKFGDRGIGTLTVQEIAEWRSGLPEGRRHAALRALRQVLQAAVRWKWIEDNPATLVKNPAPRPGVIHPFESWEEVDAIATELGDVFGPLVVLMAGVGLRPEEAFPLELRDVDLKARTLTVRRAFAKGRLKEFNKTEASRRRVPLRGKVVEAIEAMYPRPGLLFPASSGGMIDINNWRSREWKPALEAAGVDHRRIYDLRHTYATWSLAAGINIFTLARRMGTSVLMIDRTYGHLAANADDYERELLDAFDAPKDDEDETAGASDAPEAEAA